MDTSFVQWAAAALLQACMVGRPFPILSFFLYLFSFLPTTPKNRTQNLIPCFMQGFYSMQFSHSFHAIIAGCQLYGYPARATGVAVWYDV
jgi:hypothetical protein